MNDHEIRLECLRLSEGNFMTAVPFYNWVMAKSAKGEVPASAKQTINSPQVAMENEHV